MRAKIGQWVSALFAGAVFGAGLLISGMTQPRKVLGFLDVFGAWNGSLLMVMVGAIAVHAVGYHLVRRRGQPIFAAEFAVPTRRDLDVKLLLGALVFGIGWGLSGYCPGPALVSIASGDAAVVVFGLSMWAGLVLTGWLEAQLTTRRHARSSTAAERMQGLTVEPD